MVNRNRSWQDRLRRWWNWNYWRSGRTWRDKLRWYLQRFLGFWRPGVRQLGLLSCVIGILGVRPVSRGLPYDPVWTEFYHSIVPELLAIGVTVLLVDYANERRAEGELKAQLIRQMRSKHPEVAVTASEELRARNWLFDGSLQNASLSEANLQDARLWRANLQGARLWRANLKGARLRGANLQNAHLGEANLQDARLEEANLQGARLSGASLQGTLLLRANLRGADLWRANLQGAHAQESQLKEARRLVGAIMLDGDCYMGEFDLEHDKEYAAHIRGVDINDPEVLERSYRREFEEAQAYHRKRGWLRDDDENDENETPSLLRQAAPAALTIFIFLSLIYSHLKNHPIVKLLGKFFGNN